MRNYIIGFFMLVVLILGGISINTVNMRTERKNELDTAFSKAVQETLQNATSDDPTYKINNNNEAVADMIENLVVQLNGGKRTNYTVTVYTVDIEKGILDASVTETYNQVVGTGKITVRKTAIVDNTTQDTNYYTVTFKEGETVLKEVSVHSGDGVPYAVAPKRDDIVGWSYNGKTYTTDLNTLKIKKEVTFTAVTK